MTDNVVELVTPPSMGAFIVAAKEHGLHPDHIETLLREAYPHTSEREIGEAFIAAGERMREEGAALCWLATALERHAHARARPLA
jgi:hypothetical protein